MNDAAVIKARHQHGINQSSVKKQNTLLKSLKEVVQGLVIAGGTLACYQLAVRSGCTEDQIRSLVFITLVVANVFLTLVNRSFYYSVISTLRYKNVMLLGIISITLLMLILMLSIATLRNFFSFAEVEATLVVKAAALGFFSVIWFEGYKAYLRMKA